MTVNEKVYFLFDRINKAILGVWNDHSSSLNALSFIENHWKTQGENFTYERDSHSEPPYLFTKLYIDGEKSSEWIIFEADYIDTVEHIDIPTYHLPDNILIAFAQKWGVKTDDGEELNYEIKARGFGYLTYLTYSPYGRFLLITNKDRTLIYRRASTSPFIPLPLEKDPS
jgi:hypothetical protein